jgi:cytochrome c oxidase subunit IV
MSTEELTDAPEARNDPDPHGHHADGGVHAGYSDMQYVVVALILAAITAVEVAISYIDIGPVFLPALLLLMAVKFTMVVRLFMHLKFDSKLFSWMFFSGLFLAVGVYIVMLAAFHVFTG